VCVPGPLDVVEERTLAYTQRGGKRGGLDSVGSFKADAKDLHTADCALGLESNRICGLYTLSLVLRRSRVDEIGEAIVHLVIMRFEPVYASNP
jgi:hypothetical protein